MGLRAVVSAVLIVVCYVLVVQALFEGFGVGFGGVSCGGGGREVVCSGWDQS